MGYLLGRLPPPRIKYEEKKKIIKGDTLLEKKNNVTQFILDGSVDWLFPLSSG